MRNNSRSERKEVEAVRRLDSEDKVRKLIG